MGEEDEWQLFASAGYAASAEAVVDSVPSHRNLRKRKSGSMATTSKLMEYRWIGMRPRAPLLWNCSHNQTRVCDHCLHRIGGRRTKNSGSEGGKEIREDAHARDPDIAKFGAPELCPLCERSIRRCWKHCQQGGRIGIRSSTLHHAIRNPPSEGPNPGRGQNQEQTRSTRI